MLHDNLYNTFLTVLPYYKKQIKEWFPNGKNSIRVRLLNIKYDLIFTCDPESVDTKWCLESVDNFIGKLKKGES